MPTYTYECKTCGEFDYAHSMHHKLFFCIRCGEPVTKIFRVGGVSFKGKGFYSTDSRSNNG
jgi:putative FmdB family regulatory protein